MGAKWDWDESATEAAAGAGGYAGDDFDFTAVRWPMWLTASVFYSETRENSKGTGENVSVGCRIETPGPWKGHGFFQNFVYTNPSEKAQAIGRIGLGKLCTAAEFERGMDFDDLKDYSGLFDVQVDVEKSKGYPDKLTGTDWAPAGTKVSPEVCAGAAKRYKPEEPEGEAPTGSHRYNEGKGSVKDTDLDDEIPFATMGYASTRSRRSPLASIVQVPW